MTDVLSWLADDSVAIYLFHGVTDDASAQVRNYNHKHLLVDEFANTCRALKSHGTAVTMDDVLLAWTEGSSLPPRAYAITFDDGFENNHSLAAPILSDFNIPACFYVTSNFIESNTMSWVDRIELAVEDAKAGCLTLPWGKRAFDSVTSKIELLNDIRSHVKTDPSLAAQDLATDIQIQLGFTETWSSTHPLDQKMNWNQVRELHATAGFLIGGHSHTHPILAFLDDESLAWEINTGIALLKDKADITSPHYAYPEGLAHTYDARTVQLLKDNGVTCCPSAIEGVATQDQSLFDLCRIMVI